MAQDVVRGLTATLRWSWHGRRLGWRSVSGGTPLVASRPCCACQTRSPSREATRWAPRQARPPSGRSRPKPVSPGSGAPRKHRSASSTKCGPSIARRPGPGPAARAAVPCRGRRSVPGPLFPAAPGATPRACQARTCRRATAGSGEGRQPGRCGGDPLVRGRQREPDVRRARRPVQPARRSEDAGLGEDAGRGPAVGPGPGRPQV